MFIWIDNGKYIKAINKNIYYTFFLYLNNTDDFQLILKYNFPEIIYFVYGY